MRTENRGGTAGRILAFALAVTAALVFGAPVLATPLAQVALAQGDAATAQQPFAYKHNPIYNPKAMEDIIQNPDAVYGFSPNPDSGSLKEYATYDWTDPEVVAQAHQNRRVYLEQDQQIYDLVTQMEAEGATTEEVARAASAKRNQIRIDSYKDDPEGLAKLKARNLEKYGNEDGPTPEWLFDKYGSWELVLDNCFNTNSGMDACCGFYDDNWEKYIHFGQIPLCVVSFDAAGRGEAPANQSVYAGETATKPEDLVAEGWTFGGWVVKGTEEPFDFAQPIAADVVLVATWTKDPEPVPGKVEMDVNVEDGLPVVGAAVGIEAADLLSADELERVRAGEDAHVWLDVRAADVSDKTEARMLEAAGDKIGADAKLAFCVDVSLRKRLSADDADTMVTELDQEVSVELVLGDEWIPLDAANRDWYVVCEHDGEVAIIPAEFDAESKTVAFLVDRFSIFGVCYDAVKGESPSSDVPTSSTPASGAPVSSAPASSAPTRTTIVGSTSAAAAPVARTLAATGDASICALPLALVAAACLCAAKYARGAGQ